MSETFVLSVILSICGLVSGNKPSSCCVGQSLANIVGKQL